MGLAIIFVFLTKKKSMALRIKEICKEKHMTLAEVAAKIGINPITLTQSLNGNPTLNRLQEVADILEVDISELFVPVVKDTVYGCLYVDGRPFVVNSKDEILTLLKDID